MDDQVKALVRVLARLVQSHGLAELSLDAGSFKLSLVARPHLPTAPGPARAERRGRARPAAGAEAAAQVWPEGLVVRSPLLGVFYRTPAPDAPPFVEVGDVVEPGQVVGLVEAMKIYNEITAEREGRVAQVLAQDAELVHVGQALVAMEPVGTEAQSGVDHEAGW